MKTPIDIDAPHEQFVRDEEAKMARQKVDGGPAFPEAVAVTVQGDVIPGFAGMTLRQWYAGQALSGMLSNHEDTAGSIEAAVDPTAAWAFRIADAMLSEGGK